MINFNTGTEHKIFVFAMPKNRQIISAIDKGAWSLDITSAFNASNEIMVNDKNGNPVTYNVYVLDNAIPYSNNHEIIITLN